MLPDGRPWVRNELGAVDKSARVLSDNGELHHRFAEILVHEVLVVNHALPFTGSTLGVVKLVKRRGHRFSCK